MYRRYTIYIPNESPWNLIPRLQQLQLQPAGGGTTLDWSLSSPLVTVSPIILYIYTHIYTIYYALMVSYRIIIVLLCCKTVPRSLTSLPPFLLGWARNLLPYAAICQSATDIAQHCGTFHPPPPPPPNWLCDVTVMLLTLVYSQTIRLVYLFIVTFIVI